MSGFSTPCSSMFMLPMRSMVLSKSKPVEGVFAEVRLPLGIAEDLRVALAQVFAGGDEEAGGAAGRVADDVFRAGGRHLHHEPDDVARRPELTVLPGRGD